MASVSYPVRILGGMFLPRSCPLCGAVGAAPCAACAAALEPATRPPPPPGVDRCVALLAYRGEGRELVARLKYRNRRASVDWLAAQLAARVDAADVDVVTWVPTSATRRRQRGFDQAELLARAIARRLRRPCGPLLTRLAGPPQTGRSALERRQGPQLEPVASRRSPRAPLAGARVLVVDDVITTGTTATVAARALRCAGAASVMFVAAARTPLKRPTPTSEKEGDEGVRSRQP